PSCSARTRRAAIQLPIPRWPRRNILTGGGCRQDDGESGAPPRRALHGNPSAVRHHDLPGDVEPEPEAAVGRCRDRALEPAEDALGVLRRAYDPAVADDEDGAPIPRLDDDVDRLALAVLDRVGEQIRRDLLQAGPIPAPRRGLRTQLDARTARGGVPLHQLARDVRQV